MTLDEEQLRILRHMLGINTPKKSRPEPYRNYYCAPLDYQPLKELEKLGAVKAYRRDTFEWFTCTEAGKKAAMDSFKSIQVPKKQRVYSMFLSARDAYPDLTFKEFLTSEQWQEARQLA